MKESTAALVKLDDRTYADVLELLELTLDEYYEELPTEVFERIEPKIDASFIIAAAVKTVLEAARENVSKKDEKDHEYDHMVSVINAIYGKER